MPQTDRRDRARGDWANSWLATFHQVLYGVNEERVDAGVESVWVEVIAVFSPDFFPPDQAVVAEACEQILEHLFV